MKLNLGEIALGLGCSPDFAEISRTRIVPRGAQVDSRLLRPGDIFFCLEGKNADGHDFAMAAAQAGAAAVVAGRDPFLSATQKNAGEEAALPPLLLVPNVQAALLRLASCHRGTCTARVVGVTGTAGKTSVKDALFTTLERQKATERSLKNFNNQIGLPLSMLDASEDAAFWVMEAGISRRGDMEELAAVLRPDLALLLNVGDGHLEGLGEDGVAAQKALLLDYIQPGGLALLSADYPELDRECAARAATFADKNIKCLRFSIKNPQAFCFAEYLGKAGERGSRYRVRIGDAQTELTAPFLGAYGAENVAAVTAAAFCLGLSLADITAGLGSAALPQGRFKPEQCGGYIIIDDSYNSNPLSAERMLQSAAAMAREAGLPLLLVLGEMLELGEKSAAAHTRLGEAAAAAGPEIIFWKGGREDSLRTGLQKGGYKGATRRFDTAARFADLMRENAPGKALLLFKGSRANHLDEAAQSLRQAFAASDHAKSTTG
ncbi:MAG: UDP-N-acetylmuramoyl-tripeptide--D-alanyl-D-alanine ligase [Desulfovibrio sp.]|jgi:UDP-N-acetylmuramoyl-tripeptide--D-alanyl-D-alanine ligase|nr:UDP-N-acetylmuramoyl-tripeptide--D-alanyl-D-alanine ligase [Desulfovibrio sp.]